MTSHITSCPTQLQPAYSEPITDAPSTSMTHIPSSMSYSTYPYIDLDPKNTLIHDLNPKSILIHDLIPKSILIHVDIVGMLSSN